ncbi:MAG: methionine--tRNA ligase [Clostridia bacterium]|nr:methionine--tRNA ligase [Clostridia bacterium]
MEKEKFYITTAIAYTSRKPHIGNVYDPVLADAIARFKRMMGYDVFYLTGSDEHGQKIEELAKEAGISPKDYVDGVAAQIKAVWDCMNISYDRFIRTTDADHEAAVEKIFQRLLEKGDIYKGEYEGKYCVPCESFFTASQLGEGGVCPDCGRPCTDAKEEAYFLKLSKYADRLMAYYEENPEFFAPLSRKAEMVNNFIKPGLADLCVSRSTFSWGVKVKEDPRHVIYVWIDALSNYITGVGYDPDGSKESFEHYWPADLHVIGKDIVRFHTIYWPILLMALDLPLPKRVLGHPWVLVGEDKMSKSRGNVLYADDLAKIFGVDAVRYYLLSEIPFAQDGSITHEAVIAKFNADLANTLGNLVSRSVAMADKYFGGKLTRPAAFTEAVDLDLIACSEKTFAALCEGIDTLHVGDAVNAVMDFAKRCNKYIDETMPWALAKDETKKERLQDVLYNLLESIRRIGVMLYPFMPETGDKIAEALNCKTSHEMTEVTCPFGLADGFEVTPCAPLFARIDAEKLLKELAEEEKAKKKAEKAAAKEAAKAAAKAETEPPAPCTFDDFCKVELVCAKVLECERVPKSEKLLKFRLDVGTEERQVLSGIAKFYAPEELVGKNLVLVKNLLPRKMMGLESHGMLLSSEYEGTLKVLTLAEDVPAGSRIG